jgi:hypothetical protein
MARFRRNTSTAVLLALALAVFPGASWASHSGLYHWARSSNPHTLPVGDNVSNLWDPHLLIAAYDWGLSSVLDLVVVAGRTTPSTCGPTSGRIEVCTWFYGNTGWLALRQIWLSSGHISQATIKLNETYLSSVSNPSATRQYLLCNNLGLTLGLTNQNPQNGSCVGTAELNEHPNDHDYEELEAIYNHLPLVAPDGQESPRSPGEADLSEPGSWGRLVHTDGRSAVYERNLGAGQTLLTAVTWAERE